MSSKQPSASNLPAAIEKAVSNRLTALSRPRDPRRRLAAGAELIAGILEGVGTLEASLLSVRAALGLTTRPGDAPAVPRPGRALLAATPSRRRKK